MKTGYSDTIFAPFSGFRVYVGFSGGADSTAALLLTASAAEKYGFTLSAVHFNHHLRDEESDSEALAAEKFAAAVKVPFQKFDLYPAPGRGVEMRAREERLKVWKLLAGNNEKCAVVLGHHLDDRVEDLLLRLGRGSNVSGAVGLRRERVLGGVRFFRPLYDWRRSEVEEFLRSRDISVWAEDSSNGENDACRNLLRNRILPDLYAANPGSRDGFAAALENLTADAEFLEAEAASRIAAGEPENVGFWKKLPDALFGRALRMFLMKKELADLVNGASIRRFREMVDSGRSGEIPFSGGAVLRISGGRICTVAAVPPEKMWHWRDEPEIFWGSCRFRMETVSSVPEKVSANEAFFDAESLPEFLSLGAAEDGEKMVPFGSVSAVKVKKLRTDRRIPAYPALPLLRDSGRRVLWMAFVRHSAHCPVRAGGGILRIFGEKTE